jgi:hypothetical protein
VTELEKVSIREYARRKGVSDTAIHKHIKEGRITQRSLTKNESNGRPMIIVAYADADLAEHYDPHKNQSSALEAEFVDGIKPRGKLAKSVAQTGGAGLPPVPPESKVESKDPHLQQARKAAAIFDAKLKELAYKEKLGSLVDKDKVYKSLFEMGQELRAAFLAIPDRVVDEMLAATTRHEAHSILYKAINAELEKMADFASRDIAINR